MVSGDRILRNVRGALLGLLAVLVLIEGISLWNGQQRDRADIWVRHTLEVENRLDDLLSRMVDAETSARGYALLGTEDVLAPHEQARVAAPALVEDIGRLVADNPRQVARIAPLREMVAAKLAFNDEVIRTRREKGIDAARELISTRTGIRPMREIRRLHADMVAEEERLLSERTADAARLSAWANRLTLAVGALLLVALLAFASLIRRELAARARESEALALSEERLRLMIESAKDHALYMLDPHGTVVSWNAVAARMTGYSEQEILGRNFATFYRPEDVAANKPQGELERALQDGRYEEEGIRVRKDGTRFWAEVAIAPLRNGRGEHVGFGKITRDITARKKGEAELRDFASRLERSNRELQDFAMVASHDLQEPLRKIQMFGDLLREQLDGKASPEAADSLQRMQSAAARGQTLIQGLLSYSRVSSKAQPFARVELDAIAREVLVDLEARLRESGGEVQFDPLPTLEADGVQMRQLFQNLLGNALKFRRPDVPPRIQVRARPLRDGAARWELTFQDNGVGFDDKYRDKLFKLFQRLHARSAYEGAGMGLAICRRIVERHGGTIDAHGTSGSGATFVVVLPERQDHPEAAP